MIEIVIWISTTDIDDLGNTLNRLKIGQQYLTDEQRSNIKFNIVMGVSDDIIDWTNSEIDKQECIDKFLKLKDLTEWAGESDFSASTIINGCTSMRTTSGKSDSKYYIWLDTDIIFDPITFPYMLQSIKTVEDSGYSKFVITPEIVRQWDSTWDCLVNEKFINEPVGYQAKNNPHIDTIFDETKQIKLEEVRNNVPNQPYMKFGGGWFTALSKEFLKVTPFPENYGHYGLDDTYLMWYAHILQDESIKQFKIKNLIVCENYYDRQITYKNQIKFIDRREEYKKYNQELFNLYLNSLLKNRK